jgi:hypothetical protein
MRFGSSVFEYSYDYNTDLFTQIVDGNVLPRDTTQVYELTSLG